MGRRQRSSILRMCGAEAELKFPFDKTAQPMLGQEFEIFALAFTGDKVEKLLANLRLFVEGE